MGLVFGGLYDNRVPYWADVSRTVAPISKG